MTVTIKKKTMKSRVRWLFIKWITIITIITLLWFIGLFHVLFAIWFLFIDQVGLFFEWLDTGTDLGAKMYWAEYGRYWLMAYIFLAIILTVVYFIPYRKARPVLKVGNRKEGSVIWIKGIRRGLHYELWDTWNYLKKTRNTRSGEKVWPNPLAIPRGPHMRSGKCIVFRCPWSLKPKYLYVPDTVRVESRLLSVHIPDGYFVNHPNRERLDIMDLRFVERSTIGYKKFNVDIPTNLHKQHLKTSRKMVQRSVASNPEINQLDFTQGSFAVVSNDE